MQRPRGARLAHTYHPQQGPDDVPPGDVETEIAILRTALGDLVDAGLPITDLIEYLDKGTSALVRLLRVQHTLSGQRTANMFDAVDTLLSELGGHTP